MAPQSPRDVTSCHVELFTFSRQCSEHCLFILVSVLLGLLQVGLGMLGLREGMLGLIMIWRDIQPPNLKKNYFKIK